MYNIYFFGLQRSHLVLRTKLHFVTSFHFWSEHAIVDPDGHENQDKYGHIPHHKKRLWGDKIGEKGAGDGVDLMAGADEDEGGEKDFDDWIIGNEDKDTMGVCAQPDVVLGDEQLQIQSTKPGKKTERHQWKEIFE